MKDILKKLLFGAVGLVSGAAAGLFIVSRVEAAAGSIEDMSFGRFMLVLLALLAFAALAGYLQMIFHEAGHLVFGLLSGYSFVSFRVGSLMLKRKATAGGAQDSRPGLELKRFSLAGTGGQCIMCPPPLVDGRMPYVLYNLGGSLMNLITAAVFYVLSAVLPQTSPLSAFAASLTAFGVIYAVLNGVPLNTGLITNDGYNALSMGKDPAALRAFWVQLTIAERQSSGVRLKDMPAEWFVLPENADLKNPMIGSIEVFRENRAVDSRDLEAAEAACDRLLAENNDIKIPGIYTNLLQLDKAFFLMLRGETDAGLAIVKDKAMIAFMKQMRDFPSVLRTRYAEQLASGDAAEASKTLERLKGLYSSYPNPVELDPELELTGLASEKIKAS